MGGIFAWVVSGMTREERTTTTIRTENPYPNVPHPAGAVEVCDWHRPFTAEKPSRY
jgi:hypothetical protein